MFELCSADSFNEPNVKIAVGKLPYPHVQLHL